MYAGKCDKEYEYSAQGSMMIAEIQTKLALGAPEEDEPVE